MNESGIQRDIRAALCRTGRVRLVRNMVGVATINGSTMRFGLGNGSADLVGLLRNGRTFAIEVKSATGRLSHEQECWWRAYRQWNGLGGVARSVEEAMRLLEEAERA